MRKNVPTWIGTAALFACQGRCMRQQLQVGLDHSRQRSKVLSIAADQVAQDYQTRPSKGQFASPYRHTDTLITATHTFTIT